MGAQNVEERMNTRNGTTWALRTVGFIPQPRLRYGLTLASMYSNTQMRRECEIVYRIHTTFSFFLYVVKFLPQANFRLPCA